MARGDKAKKIMGESGRKSQIARKMKARTDKQKTIETVRRVGEYKAATKQKAKIKRMDTPLARAVAKQHKADF